MALCHGEVEGSLLASPGGVREGSLELLELLPFWHGLSSVWGREMWKVGERGLYLSNKSFCWGYHILQGGNSLKICICCSGQNFLCTPSPRDRFTTLDSRPALEPLYIGLFGSSGAGKSTLLNTILGKRFFLPVSGTRTCTSCQVHVSVCRSKHYEAKIFLLSDEVRLYSGPTMEGCPAPWPGVEEILPGGAPTALCSLCRGSSTRPALQCC